MTREYYNERTLKMCDEIFRELWEENAAVRCKNNEEAYGRLQKAYMTDKGESKCVSNAMDYVTQALYTGEEFERRVNQLYGAALSQAAAAMGLAVLARMIYEQETLYPGSAGKTPMEALVERIAAADLLAAREIVETEAWGGFVVPPEGEGKPMKIAPYDALAGDEHENA